MHALPHSVPPTLHQVTADPCLCWRFLDTHGQVWVCSLWGYCSILLSPGEHKVLFMPSKSLFSQSCKFWWLYGGVNGDLLQEGLCHTQVSCTQSPCLCDRPLLTQTPTGDTQTLKSRYGSISVRSPGVHRFCLSPLNSSGRYGVWF